MPAKLDNEFATLEYEQEEELSKEVMSENIIMMIDGIGVDTICTFKQGKASSALCMVDFESAKAGNIYKIVLKEDQIIQDVVVIKQFDFENGVGVANENYVAPGKNDNITIYIKDKKTWQYKVIFEDPLKENSLPKIKVNGSDEKCEIDQTDNKILLCNTTLTFPEKSKNYSEAFPIEILGDCKLPEPVRFYVNLLDSSFIKIGKFALLVLSLFLL